MITTNTRYYRALGVYYMSENSIDFYKWDFNTESFKQIKLTDAGKQLVMQCQIEYTVFAEVLRNHVANKLDNPIIKNIYYKDGGEHISYMSGLPLPSDSDNVIRHKTFINCDFHPVCFRNTFEHCTFVNCDISCMSLEIFNNTTNIMID